MYFMYACMCMYYVCMYAYFQVHMHNHRLTEGMLKVEVIECSRLALVDLAVEIYCTLELCKSAFTSIHVSVDEHLHIFK